METRAAQMEDLPALELTPLRSLELERPPAAGRPAHLASASGVVRRGDFVYVIGDEQVHLGVFRLTDPRPGRLARALEGELPAGRDARKAAKPDLEALTVLPPFPGHAYGALLGLGSGSGPGRDRGFVWPLAPNGSLRGHAAQLDLAPLYERLAREIDSLNVEGACVMGSRLWLLQRGNHDGSPNAIAELELEDVMASARGDGRIDAWELAGLRIYELGRLEGVQLTFSDATPLGGDLLVFTASAEVQAEGPADGEIRGSVVGTIGVDGQVRRLRTIDRRYKVEGVHASVDTGVMDFLFVCDQDDPGTPSPLLSAAMPLDGRVEHEG